MKEKIRSEIAYLEFEIKETQERLDREVEQFKAFISKSDSRDIAGIPQRSKFQAIQSDVKTICDLDNKKRWLLHLINEPEVTPVEEG